MANDYFPMAGPSEPGETAAEERAEGAHNETEEQQGPTALVPKSLLAGKDFKPGEEVVFKIVRMLDDEVEVAYAPEKPGGESKGPSADEEIDTMAGGGGNPGGMGGGY